MFFIYTFLRIQCNVSCKIIAIKVVYWLWFISVKSRVGEVMNELSSIYIQYPVNPTLCPRALTRLPLLLTLMDLLESVAVNQLQKN